MDHTGAVLGPILASAFLFAFPDRYRMLFALAAIPGMATVVLLLGIKERPHAVPSIRSSESPTISGGALPWELKRYLFVLSVFTLGNSADAFLLLRLTEAAGGPQLIPLFWSALHVVKMTTSLVGGSASDRFGRRPLIAAGWIIYAAVYAGFAFASSLWMLVAWFLLYGAYYGAVEGTERAFVVDFAHRTRRGTAFGIYNGVTGIGALVSSVVFGLIWNAAGSTTAFLTGALLALVAAGLLFVLVPAPSDNSEYETYPGHQ
jgi:MFS family permease